jgi:hypothetical protein
MYHIVDEMNFRKISSHRSLDYAVSIQKLIKKRLPGTLTDIYVGGRDYRKCAKVDLDELVLFGGTRK